MRNKITVFFHPYFSDGGVERTNLGLAKGIIENGGRVIFLTTSYTDHFLAEIKESGIELVSMGDKKVSAAIPDVVRFLNGLTKEGSLNFISCQYYVNVISMIVSILVRRRSKITFINAERNHLNEFSVNPGIKSRVIPLLVKLLYKKADMIIANSSETAEDLQHILHRRVHFVYNPVINTRMSNLQKEPITEKWYLADPRKTIIGVGRLSAQKDFETLIRAYDLIGDKCNYKLVILGEGTERQNLAMLSESLGLSDDIYMPGFVENPYKFIKDSELFVLSSRYEGLPNVLIEAMAMGTPAISTKCKSGPQEIFGNDFYLVDERDHVAMAEKMQYCLKNRDETIDIQKTIDLSRFEYSRIVKQFVELM